MSAPLPAQRTITIPFRQLKLHGRLVQPEAMCGLVIFAGTCIHCPAPGTDATESNTKPDTNLNTKPAPDPEPVLESDQETIPESPPPEETGTNELIAAALHQQGFGTLHIDLMQDNECRFPDAGRHLPLLQERLLAVVSHLRRQIAMEAMPDVPVGLFATDSGTPLAIRVAAQRDHDIRTLVCLGGLVDLAGRLYLRLLQAPLLLITDSHDTAAQANAARARIHIPGSCEFRQLADDTPAARQDQLTDLIVGWFRMHLTG